MGIEAMLGRKRQLSSAYNVCTKRIDVAALSSVAQGLMALYETQPDARASSLSIEWYGADVVGGVPEEAMAFAWRDSKAYL